MVESSTWTAAAGFFFKLRTLELSPSFALFFEGNFRIDDGLRFRRRFCNRRWRWRRGRRRWRLRLGLGLGRRFWFGFRLGFAL
jgi:hypothetical protein